MAFFLVLRAEQLASVAPSLDQLMKSKQPSFKRKLRSKFGDKRSRSVSSVHHLKEDSFFGMSCCSSFCLKNVLCVLYICS